MTRVKGETYAYHTSLWGKEVVGFLPGNSGEEGEEVLLAVWKSQQLEDTDFEVVLFQLSLLSATYNPCSSH